MEMFMILQHDVIPEKVYIYGTLLKYSHSVNLSLFVCMELELIQGLIFIVTQSFGKEKKKAQVLCEHSPSWVRT